MAAIKESSDELNPSVAVSDRQIPARGRRSAVDYVALAIATCGVGYFPIAPGTLGSLVGVALHLALAAGANTWFETYGAQSGQTTIYTATAVAAPTLVACFVVTIVGTWAASRTEQLIRKKDPSVVVVDEVAGQMIALVSALWLRPWWAIITAFVMFRAFDILKPYPIRKLERLKGGRGIMADDVLAGIYALIANAVLVTGYLLFVRG